MQFILYLPKYLYIIIERLQHYKILGFHIIYSQLCLDFLTSLSYNIQFLFLFINWKRMAVQCIKVDKLGFVPFILMLYKMKFVYNFIIDFFCVVHYYWSYTWSWEKKQFSLELVWVQTTDANTNRQTRDPLKYPYFILLIYGTVELYC